MTLERHLTKIGHWFYKYIHLCIGHIENLNNEIIITENYKNIDMDNGVGATKCEHCHRYCSALQRGGGDAVGATESRVTECEQCHKGDWLERQSREQRSANNGVVQLYSSAQSRSGHSYSTDINYVPLNKKKYLIEPKYKLNNIITNLIDEKQHNLYRRMGDDLINPTVFNKIQNGVDNKEVQINSNIISWSKVIIDNNDINIYESDDESILSDETNITILPNKSKIQSVDNMKETGSLI